MENYFTQETIENELGAKEAGTIARFDLIPPEAMFKIAEILHEGAQKYGEENWRGLNYRTNLNHALQHIYGHLAGDKTEDHLAHAACRILFALALRCKA